MSLYKAPYFKVGLKKLLGEEDNPRRVRATILEEEDLILTLIVYLEDDTNHITNPDSKLMIKVGETMLHVEFNGNMHWIGLSEKGTQSIDLVGYGRRVKEVCESGECVYRDHYD